MCSNFELYIYIENPRHRHPSPHRRRPRLSRRLVTTRRRRRHHPHHHHRRPRRQPHRQPRHIHATRRPTIVN